MITGKNKIAILEFDYHPEVLRNTLIILSKLDYSVEVYTLEEIWKKVKLSPAPFFSVYTCSKSNINSFVLRKSDQINSSDLIFFNTIVSNFKLFSKFNFKKPVVVRVHNANFTLQPFKSIYPKFTPFFIWKHTSYTVTNLILKLDLYFSRKFFNHKVDYFAFPNAEIKNYLLDTDAVDKSQTMGDVPFIFNNNSNFSKSSLTTETVISIIGEIDKRRRDYDQVYRVLKKIITDKSQNIELKLLGKPFGGYGKKMVNKFEKLQNENFKVTYFNKFVPQDEFENHIAETDFLIIPIPEKTHYKIYKEMYGKTKISGNITDMVIYNKPAILPKSYLLSEDLKKVTQQYETEEELEKVVREWISSKQFRQFDFSNINHNFSVDTIAQTVKASFDAIIKNAKTIS